MDMKFKRVVHRIRRRLVSAPRDTYGQNFNTAVKFIGNDWFVNERIVEVAFALRQISLETTAQRILEFGCARSDLALQLASFGYEVIGIDLRPYPFTHPNLQFKQINLLEFSDDIGFDYITAISVIEHIGLGVYGEGQSRNDLKQVARKMGDLLKPNGKLIVTVPFGKAYEDQFLQSFTYEQITRLFARDDLKLDIEMYFCRHKLKHWQPCSREETITYSNAKIDRGPTGVNCVGCFVWQKKLS
jgi:2-polyprenyl-3-methyl-5-hydroxy-6-metoxy-1,4-benzoquinol methylase